MGFILGAVGLIAISGFVAFFCGRSPVWTMRIATSGVVVACALAAAPAVRVLGHGPSSSYRIPWPVPGGDFSVGLDPLSAFFLVPVLALSALASIYGAQYMQAYGSHRSLAAPALGFNLLIASIVMVLIARNGLLFMLAWELMSLSGFFMVTLEHENSAVRRAGFYYMVATHIGAMSLFALFTLLGRSAGDLNFDGFHGAASHNAAWKAVLYGLALVGFGAKAGFVPYHVWLPEAHPAAPSHVSAIMSGVMIKTGIYGILRVLSFLGAPAAWWGLTLIVVGLAGALLGIALALQQRDLKRALAYSSIENVGLIAVGLGVGIWGIANGQVAMSVLGIAGGLFHVWNHATMKGLLFMAAGGVMHASGTKDIEKLGGLLHLMPRTGAAMIVGAVAIAGLPPLNGFVSEWLIYMGLMRGGLVIDGVGRAVLLLTIGAIALVGGMAVACYVRIVGVVWLGQPRDAATRTAHELPMAMTVPLLCLAATCAVMAIAPRLMLSAVAGVAEQVQGIPRVEFLAMLDSADSPVKTLGVINGAVWFTIGLAAVGLGVIRRRPLVAPDSTWGCGYVQPTSRMQYTGSSIAEFLSARVFPRWLRPRVSRTIVRQFFPANSSFETESPDPLSTRVYEPLFARIANRFVRLRWLQQGKVHVYLVYILVVLVGAFGWVSLRRWIME